MHTPCTHATVGQVTQSGAKKTFFRIFYITNAYLMLTNNIWTYGHMHTHTQLRSSGAVPDVWYRSLPTLVHRGGGTWAQAQAAPSPAASMVASIAGGTVRHLPHASHCTQDCRSPCACFRTCRSAPQRPRTLTVIKEAIIDIVLRNLPNSHQHNLAETAVQVSGGEGDSLLLLQRQRVRCKGACCSASSSTASLPWTAAGMAAGVKYNLQRCSHEIIQPARRCAGPEGRFPFGG